MGVCRNIQNNDLYLYLGNDTYRNLRTGKDGIVEPELAKKILRINLDATELILGNPIIETLIRTLNLKSDGMVGD